MKPDKAVLIMGLFLVAAYILLVVVTLWRGEISRITYGCTGFVAVLYMFLYFVQTYRLMRR